MSEGLSEYRLAELAQMSGIEERTIRNYISMGLLEAPERRGANTRYSQHHLTRLRAIAALRERKASIPEIKLQLATKTDDEIDRLADSIGHVGATSNRTAREYLEAVRRDHRDWTLEPTPVAVSVAQPEPFTLGTTSALRSTRAAHAEEPFSASEQQLRRPRPLSNMAFGKATQDAALTDRLEAQSERLMRHLADIASRLERIEAHFAETHGRRDRLNVKIADGIELTVEPDLAQEKPGVISKIVQSIREAIGAEDAAPTRGITFEIAARGLRDLADRLESSERRAQAAIAAVNQSVAEMQDRIDAAGRVKKLAGDDT